MAKYTSAQKKEAEAKYNQLLSSAPSYDATYQNKYKELLNTAPTPYQSQYQTHIDSLLDKINNREAFSYDFNKDALYGQYKDRYQKQGKMAMMDTMANATALSGGYDNSYANTAGQLAYQGYLEGLNDIIPDLQQNAYGRYSDEGNKMQGQLANYRDSESDAYGKYQGALGDYYNRLNAYKSADESMYSRYQSSLADYNDQLAYYAGIAGSGGSGGGKPTSNTDDLLDTAIRKLTTSSSYGGASGQQEMMAFVSNAVASGKATKAEGNKIVKKAYDYAKSNPYKNTR